MAAILLVFAGLARAAGSGGQAGDFLRQDPTARGAALGGALTALTDDASSLRWNPAGLARLSKPEVTATHVTLFEDTTYDFVAGALAARRWGGLAAGYVRQGSGGFEQRSSPNDAATTFSIDQSALLVGWGLSLPYVDVGAVLKSVHESIAGHAASGTGADVGAILRPGGPWLLGARLANAITPKLTFVSTPISYARTLELSPAYEWRLNRDWTAVPALELSRTEGAGTDVSGGLELQYGKIAALRVGVEQSGFSTGVGARLGNSEFGYSAVLHDLGLSHLFSFTQRFGHTREELEETIRKGISELSHTEGARLSKAYLEKAEDDLRRDDVQQALRELEAASLLDPENESIKSRIRSVSERWDRTLRAQTIERTSTLAQQQQDQGNLLAARQYWKSVQELDPQNENAHDRVAEIDRSLSHEQKIKLDDLRRQRVADEARLALEAAELDLAHGRYRQARAEAEKASDRFPGAPELAAFLPRVEQQLGEYVSAQLAESDRLAAAGSYADALHAIEGALREDPGNTRLNARAVELRAKLQRALTPEDRKQFEQLYYRAVESYLRGDLDAADNFSKEVSRIDPSSDAARQLREKIDAARRYAK